MKALTLLPLAFAFSACAWFDSDYAEYKRQKELQAQQGAYGNTGGYQAANSYGSPNVPAESGTYTPTTPSNPTPGSGGSYYGANDDSGTYTAGGGGGATRSHTVVKGDTLWGISRKYGVSVNAIKSANNLSDNLIVVGSTLTIPAR